MRNANAKLSVATRFGSCSSQRRLGTGCRRSNRRGQACRSNHRRRLDQARAMRARAIQRHLLETVALSQARQSSDRCVSETSRRRIEFG